MTRNISATNATLETVRANGLDFHVGVAGCGSRLLFLTGSNGDLRLVNTPLNSPLVDDFEVLTFDQRGMGQSSKPDRPYSMLEYAEDAIAILDAIGWGQVKVVGYSFGGMVAQEMAIRWPERISRLALVATTAGGAGGLSYPIHEFIDLEPRDRARRSIEVADTRFTTAWQEANPDEANTRIETKMVAQSQFSSEPGAAIGTARQLAARAQHDTYDRLHKISQPTLVLGGHQDGQAPLVSQQAMAKRISNCQFKSIEGSHGMLWENTTTFEMIAGFMKATA